MATKHTQLFPIFTWLIWKAKSVFHTDFCCLDVEVLNTPPPPNIYRIFSSNWSKSYSVSAPLYKQPLCLTFESGIDGEPSRTGESWLGLVTSVIGPDGLSLGNCPANKQCSKLNLKLIQIIKNLECWPSTSKSYQVLVPSL